MEGAPTLSICMIARDEAARLPQALASVRAVADEIVLVDTGSADDTAAIARLHGARVVQDPWSDDFSQARNRALESASGDWILCLDADERLAAGQDETLRQLLQEPVDAYFVSIRSPLAGDQAGQAFVHLFQRLFRNHPDVRFQGRVHEQVASSLASIAARVAVADVVIDHEGYACEPQQRQEKLRRNLRLLQLDLAERPHDAFVNFHLGETKSMLGQFAAAVEHYESALHAGGLPREYDAAAHQNLASAFLKLAQWELAIRHAGASLEVIPSARTPLLIRASARTRLSDFEQAIADIEKYLAPKNESSTAPAQLFGFELDRARAFLIRGQCKLQQGRTQEAEEDAMRVLETRRDWTGGHRLLASVCEAKGEISRAIVALRQATQLEPDHAPTWVHLVRLQIDNNDLESALEAAAQGLAHAESAELFNSQGWLLITTGDLLGAIASYENVLRLAPGSPHALKRLAGLHRKLGDLEQARLYLHQLESNAVELLNTA